MIVSLRKGHTSIEFQYKYGAASVGAVKTTLEIVKDCAVIATVLKPVNGNQRSDAGDIFGSADSGLKAIIFKEEQIAKTLIAILNRQTQVKNLGLCIIFDGIHKYAVGGEVRNGYHLVFTVLSMD